MDLQQAGLDVVVDDLHRLAVVHADRRAQHRLPLREVAQRTVQQRHVQRAAAGDAPTACCTTSWPGLNSSSRRSRSCISDSGARRLVGAAHDRRAAARPCVAGSLCQQSRQPRHGRAHRTTRAATATRPARGSAARSAAPPAANGRRARRNRRRRRAPAAPSTCSMTAATVRSSSVRGAMRSRARAGASMSGAGSALRSILPLGSSGIASSARRAAAPCSRAAPRAGARSSAASSGPCRRLRPRRSATRRTSPGRSSRAITTQRATSGWLARLASISPSSMR